LFVSGTATLATGFLSRATLSSIQAADFPLRDGKGLTGIDQMTIAVALVVGLLTLWLGKQLTNGWSRAVARLTPLYIALFVIGLACSIDFGAALVLGFAVLIPLGLYCAKGLRT
jgi:hypothetical protein